MCSGSDFDPTSDDNFLGSSVQSFGDGVKDLGEGIVEGDLDKITEGTLNTMTFGTYEATSDYVSEKIYEWSGQEEADRLAAEQEAAAMELQEKQAALREVDRVEALRSQTQAREQAVRENFRQTQIQQAQLQNLQAQQTGTSSALQGAMGSIGSTAASNFGRIQEDFSSNVDYINTTAMLGGDITNLRQNLADLGMQQQQIAQDQATRMSYLTTGASIGASFGPAGFAIGAGAGLLLSGLV